MFDADWLDASELLVAEEVYIQGVINALVGTETNDSQSYSVTNIRRWMLMELRARG